MTQTSEPTVRSDSEISKNSRNLDRWSLVFIGLAAIFGWTGSFIGLHAYALSKLSGYNTWTAWAIPGAYDLAAFGCTFAVFRASINGRSAFRGRLMMWGFTAVSASINWIHQTTYSGHFVASGLPVAAVIVFDFLMTELRADWEKAHGRKAFRLRSGLLLLRYLVDRKGTKAAFRDQITAIPVSALAGLGADLSESVRKHSDTLSADPDTSDTTRATEPDNAAQPDTETAAGRGSRRKAGQPDTASDTPSESASDVRSDTADAARPTAPAGPIVTMIDGQAGHSVPDMIHANGHSVGQSPATIPGARTSGTDTTDKTPDLVSYAAETEPAPGKRQSLTEVVRQVYSPNADTAEIRRVVIQLRPEARPDSIDRAVTRVRKEFGHKPDTTGTTGPGQYL